MHAHVCARLSTDPGICNLVKKAAVGWFAAEKHQMILMYLYNMGQNGNRSFKKERLLKLAKDEFID